MGFVRKIVEDANAAGVVAGLSEGVDSSLVATLCVRALGKERFLVLSCPQRLRPHKTLGIRRRSRSGWG